MSLDVSSFCIYYFIIFNSLLVWKERKKVQQGLFFGLNQMILRSHYAFKYLVLVTTAAANLKKCTALHSSTVGAVSLQTHYQLNSRAGGACEWVLPQKPGLS